MTLAVADCTGIARMCDEIAESRHTSPEAEWLSANIGLETLKALALAASKGVAMSGIKVGDVVRSKDGGPAMTVERIDAKCSYVQDGATQHATLDVETLEASEPDEEPVLSEQEESELLDPEDPPAEKPDAETEG